MGKRSSPALPRPAWIGSLPGGGGAYPKVFVGGAGGGGGGVGVGSASIALFAGGGS